MVVTLANRKWLQLAALIAMGIVFSALSGIQREESMKPGSSDDTEDPWDVLDRAIQRSLEIRSFQMQTNTREVLDGRVYQLEVVELTSGADWYEFEKSGSDVVETMNVQGILYSRLPDGEWQERLSLELTPVLRESPRKGGRQLYWCDFSAVEDLAVEHRLSDGGEHFIRLTGTFHADGDPNQPGKIEVWIDQSSSNVLRMHAQVDNRNFTRTSIIDKQNGEISIPPVEQIR
jgi:hypothetical protein